MVVTRMHLSRRTVLRGLGASLALVYWPLVGALVCAATAFVVVPARWRTE